MIGFKEEDYKKYNKITDEDEKKEFADTNKITKDIIIDNLVRFVIDGNYYSYILDHYNPILCGLTINDYQLLSILPIVKPLLGMDIYSLHKEELVTNDIEINYYFEPEDLRSILHGNFPDLTKKITLRFLQEELSRKENAKNHGNSK